MIHFEAPRMFTIVYTDPETGETKETEAGFYDTASTKAEKWAENYACKLAGKSNKYTVTEKTGAAK